MAENKETNSDKPSWTAGDYADRDGHFRRPESRFRSFVSADANAEFPAEKDRYVLYVSYGCPWAHRTLITRLLKGLEDIIPVVESPGIEESKGWFFVDGGEPLYGAKYIRELYFKADPNYQGKFTVPVLWDKKKETIVNNESSEIIRMFYTGFDNLLPSERREESKGKAGLLPNHLRSQIDEMNEWVYHTINNGVYKTGFASTQEAYDANVYPIFESLDRLEKHLADPGHQPYLFGENITEADIRLYTTLIRFDVAYFTIFKCNLKMIRYEYPNLHRWLRNLYWDESKKTGGGAFRKTTRFQAYKEGYTRAAGGKRIVPAGPVPEILPL